MHDAMVAGGTVMTVAMILGFLVLVLWLLLPFAVFGTKPRLERIEFELQHTNRLLERLVARLEREEPRASGETGEPKPPDA
jgi:fumarate reductase subunit D